MSTSTESDTESRAIKLKSELEDAFFRATSLDGRIEAFEKMASASCFTQSDLAVYCWSTTKALVQFNQSHNPQLLLTFGKAASNFVVTANRGNIGDIPCFGQLYSKIGVDDTRIHGLSLFVACVCYLLGTAFHGLKKYSESLRYLNMVDSCLSEFEKNDDSRCLKNCVRHVLIATWKQLYKVKAATGKRDEAIVQARKVLEFVESTMSERSIELCNPYIDAYEAYVATLNAEQAIPLCEKALDICIRCKGVNSRKVALLRVDLAALYNVVGASTKAAQEMQLWQSVLKNTDGSSDFLKAELKGATMLFNFGKYKDAVDVLEVVVLRTDMDAGGRVSAFLTMATASCKLENFDDAGKYLTGAERILKDSDFDDIFVGIVYLDMSELYEKMNGLETAISLLKRVWEITVHNQETNTEVQRKLGYQNLLAASCERLFMLISLQGRVKEEALFMIDVAEKLNQIVGQEHIEAGYGCANFGASLIKSNREDQAVKVVKKAKDIMDVALGPHNVDSLRMSHTLSEIYTKLGRYDEATELQVKVVEDIKGLEPSEQQFKDKAVRQLNKLREIVAKSPTSASSQSQYSKDLTSEKSDCGTSGDGICPP